MAGYIGLDFTEQAKMIARRQAQQLMIASDGYITSMDPVKKIAKVMLQPLGIETGWIPLGFMYGLSSMPPEGTAVVVVFEMGNLNVGRIIVCSDPAAPNRKPIARVGDSVSVTVPGVGVCTGTITSGSSIIEAG